MGAVDINLDALFDNTLGIVSKLIPDKDKAAELKFKIEELRTKVTLVIINQQTVPWVDALVKFIYAFKPFLRPVGSFVLAGFAMYAETHDIVLDEWVERMLYGAPFAWGYSRHTEKKNQNWLQKLTGAG
ncbi:hypothetical protein KAR91_08535 [Candidatus Pacearchaeota archaeon]|nr:hypothetical protein [Candidatus Pacearchaeota archaeon]